MASTGVSKLSIRDLELEGKRLFLRVDFNVPLADGTVSDDTRIQAALPSIRLAVEKKARVVLASHLGRPKGERKAEFSLQPVAHRLSELLGRPVAFAEDCVNERVEREVKKLLPGEVLLLENLRFHAGETKNDPVFAARLAAFAEEYVNDAFGTAHRAHASTVGVPQALGRGAAGLLMEAELAVLSRILKDPVRPLVAIFGGAKVSDKIDVIENFLNRADSIVLGGGMAFTFLKAQGKSVGSSLLEEDKLEIAAQLLRKAGERGVEILLPVDLRIAREVKSGVETRVVSADNIPDGWMGLDIGPQSVACFEKPIAAAEMVIWNGPMGVFEIEEFSAGTSAVARAVSASQAFSVVGGGDSVAALKKNGLADSISHVSTGGGASLEFLGGKTLPGVEILSERKQ